ncbi:hypothetical protein RCO28_36130 [Streptomyces sp. LHD-70]|uniref:hypothetical protein n=1 Tax=Streptomyces sp. LHD-70 TaxID=3072140 RepID=UPI00280DD5E8|nr:hypothetical protein [Streptomyces sp. LHD-70]MDQ8707859.1 hypothetical protein [Streptomyces sp. LHD-70]
MTAGTFPYLLGHAEIAFLYGVERQTSQLWRTREILPEPDFVVSGNPYWFLPTVLGLAEPHVREANKERLKTFKAERRGWYVVDKPEDLPSVIGLKEIPWLFGKKYGDIYQWRTRNSFVKEDAVVSGSPLWLLDTVLADAVDRGRTVLPEAIKRIQAGEREGLKPRGRKKSTESKPKPPELPPTRTYKPGEADLDEVTAFIKEIWAAGLTVSVRAKR